MITLARYVGLAASAVLLVLMLGPFQGAEEASGQDDKVLHALAFAVVTASLFLLAPSLGRLRIGGLALLLGITVEVIQGLTGRDASLTDVAADLVGIVIVAAAWRSRRLV